MATSQPASRFNATLAKRLLLLGVVLVAIVIFYRFGSYLRLDYLVAREAQLRALQSTHPGFVFISTFLIYVTVTGLSIPGATALSLVCGWYFGFWPALLLVSFASTTGATIAFLLSRYFFREAVERRFADRLHSFMSAIARDGPFYLLTLRLIPQVPFFVVNVVMGLTPMPTRTYWWVSQLGMLPGTAIYLYAASRIPSLQTLAERGPKAILSPQVVVALGLLGALPLLVRGALWLIRLARDKAWGSPKVLP